MKIFNTRLGLAMNSSSTHSLIFLDQLVDKPADKGVSDKSFGWDFFTASSKESKKDYLALTVYSNLKRLYPDDVAFAVTKELFGFDVSRDSYGVEGYVDHQSEIALPRTWDERGLDKEFVEDFSHYLLDNEDLIILGGNDNTDSAHPLASKGKDASLGMPLEGNKGLVSRKDQKHGYWTLFNRATGAKFRFSFDRQTPVPEKASTPELVDLKITDFCPYNCEFCYMDSTLRGKHASMQEIEKVIAQLRRMKVFEVALGGGEPTLHPKFVDILRKLNQSHIVANFTTKSLAWLKDASQWREVVRYAKGFAYSVEKASDIKDLIALLNTNALKYAIQPSVQHVVGVAASYELKSILETSYQNSRVRLTLLGFKTDGRGHTVTPKISAEEAFNVVKSFAQENPYFRIGIDTALAKEWEPLLEKSGVSKTLYHTEEGKHSMYVDAVEGFCAPASYGEGDKVSYSTNYYLYHAGGKSKNIARQGPTLEEAFKSF